MGGGGGLAFTFGIPTYFITECMEFSPLLSAQYFTVWWAIQVALCNKLLQYYYSEAVSINFG